MNNMDQVWQRLAERVRRAAPMPAPEPPAGFSQRVVARWRSAGEESAMELYFLFARRVFASGTLLLVGALMVNYVLLQGVWDLFSGSVPLLEMVLAL